jgi:hypothetical protein
MSPFARRRASSLPAPSPSVPVASGVFLAGQRSRPPTSRPIPTPDSIAASVLRALALPAIAVLLAPSCGLPVRATSRPIGAPTDDQGFSLALRLHAWLGDLGDAEHGIAPTFLAPWLRPVVHAIVPIASPGWCAGHLLVPAKALTRASLYTLRDRAFELALSVEEADRAWSIAQLGT